MLSPLYMFVLFFNSHNNPKIDSIIILIERWGNSSTPKLSNSPKVTQLARGSVGIVFTINSLLFHSRFSCSPFYCFLDSFSDHSFPTAPRSSSSGSPAGWHRHLLSHPTLSPDNLNSSAFLYCPHLWCLPNSHRWARRLF